MATRSIEPVRSVKDQVSADEWQVRIDLAAAYRMVAHYGWDNLIFTHLTAKVPGHEEFLINPLGLMFEEVTASNLVKVDLEGNILLSSTGLGINAAGYTIHSAVHGARPDVGAVFHTHTHAGIAVSCQEEGLLPISQTALTFYKSVTYHDYESIALYPEEKARLVADLGQSHAMILRNHGLMTVGPTVGMAFLALFMLEEACAIQIAAQAGGAPLIRQPQAVIDLVHQQAMHAAGLGRDESWPAMVRKAERLDPSFRN